MSRKRPTVPRQKADAVNAIVWDGHWQRGQQIGNVHHAPQQSKSCVEVMNSGIAQLLSSGPLLMRISNNRLVSRQRTRSRPRPTGDLGAKQQQDIPIRQEL